VRPQSACQREQVTFSLTKSGVNTTGASRAVTFYTKYIQVYIDYATNVRTKNLIIINTSYQKLPFGSRDYPDSLSSYQYITKH